MIVVFSGLDGTGKTTQTKHLIRHIKAGSGHCGYRHAIKDSLYYFIVHNIVGRMSSRAMSGLENGIRREKKGLSFYFLASVKKFFLLIDVIYFRLRYGSRKGNRSKNIVCDRYFYDEIVQAKYLSLAGDTFSRLYTRLTLEPDITFFAVTDPEAASKRKDEGFDSNYFTAKAGLYDECMKGKKVQELSDAGEDVVKESVISCWDKMSADGKNGE